MTPNQYQQEGHTSYVTQKDILSALAYWAIRQSPYTFPVNLELCLRKADEWLSANVTFDVVGMKEFAYDQMIWLTRALIDAIPEIREWNLSKNEIERGISVDDENRGHVFVSRYGGPSADNDFIDLGALSRNTAHTCLIDNYTTKSDSHV